MSQFNFRVRSPRPFSVHSNEDDNVAASPIAAMAFGSWPSNEQRLYCEALGDAGHRIAAAGFMDLNATAVERVREWARRNQEKGDERTTALFPSLIPNEGGLNRNPQNIKGIMGPLERECQAMASQMAAALKGCSPDVLLYLLGVGGHALVPMVMRPHLTGSLGNGPRPLVVTLLPDDPTHTRWLLGPEGVLAGWQEHFGGEVAVFADNRVGNSWPGGLQAYDRTVAATLAAPELAHHANQANGTTGDLIAMFYPTRGSGGFIGLSATESQLPLSEVKSGWKLQGTPPFITRRRVYQIRKGRGLVLQQEISAAVWASFDPAAQIAEHQAPSESAPQRATVILPVENSQLPDIERDVREFLRAQGLFVRYPGLSLAFGCGLTESPSVFVARCYPLERVASLDRRIEVANQRAGEDRRAGGFAALGSQEEALSTRQPRSVPVPAPAPTPNGVAAPH